MFKPKVISFIWILSLIFIFFGCGANPRQIKRLQNMEEGVSNPTTVEELQEAIKKYEKRVIDITLADAQTGIWYKLLASRYLDQQMYGKALENYQKAIEFFPANQNLYYYVGICAGFLAKSSLDYEANGSKNKQISYFRLAESAYLRAIELQDNYTRALYGIGALYVRELNESEKAIPYLERLLQIDTKNSDAMSLLAKAYYMNYEFSKAVDVYDKIISVTTSPEKKAEAETNKKIVLDIMYEE